jgi:CRISPR/Cas system-associated exonuclease Cas4 (RecB family)
MRVSPTALYKFETCQYAFYLQSIRAKGVPNCRNFITGSVVDELVQMWSKAGWQPGFMQKHLDRVFEQYLANNRVEWKQISKATLNEFKATDDRSLVHNRLERYIPKVERMFLTSGIPLDKLVLQRHEAAPIPKHEEHQLAGTCDFWLPDTRTIYEMKVTYNKEWLNRDQLIFYAVLFLLVDKKKVDKLLFISPLQRDRLIPVEFEDRDMRELLSRVWNMIQIVQAKAYKPAGKQRQCFSCDFRTTSCPVWVAKPIQYTVTDKGKEVKF